MKIFETKADLVAASLTAGQLTSTKGYTTAGDGGGATYLIKTAVDYGGTPDEAADFTLANGNVAVRQLNASVKAEHTVSQYSTLGDDLSGTLSFTHSAGTEETQTTSITTEADSLYLLTVDLTTTADGYIKISADDDLLYGDQPNGVFFSTAAVFTDATENNRVLNDTSYSYVISTFNSTYSLIKLVTDTSWAGTVNSVSFKKITSRPMAFSALTYDEPLGGVEYGIKTPDKFKNDIAVGDVHTLAAQQSDGGLVGSANIAFGSYTLMATQFGDQNTAIGSYALMTNEGSNNTAVGYSALKLNNKGQENTSVGYKSGSSNTTGYKNTYMGFWAGNRNQTGLGNTVVGWQNNTSGVSKSYTTALGYNAGSGYSGSTNTFLGALSGISVSGQEDITATTVTGLGAETKPLGTGSTAVGYQAACGTEGSPADNAVAVGTGSNGDGTRSVAIGYNSTAQFTGSIAIGDTALGGADGGIGIGDAANASGSRAIAIGESATATSTQGTAVGSLSKATEGTTAIGQRAGANWTGTYNTFVGWLSGLNTAQAYSNCTLLGQGTTTTGDNQIQLGNSATTTYAYGAVQNRSDKRDKLDICDLTDAHIAFFMDVEWKQFRFDYREAYVDIDEETGERIVHPQDGSRAGSRFHIGAIAQQVQEAMQAHGVDFAGLQHHSVNGGEDLYSIGYQEFIGIQGVIIQRQQAKLNDIEARLQAAGI